MKSVRNEGNQSCSMHDGGCKSDLHVQGCEWVVTTRRCFHVPTAYSHHHTCVSALTLSVNSKKQACTFSPHLGSVDSLVACCMATTSHCIGFMESSRFHYCTSSKIIMTRLPTVQESTLRTFCLAFAQSFCTFASALLCSSVS